MRAAIKVSLFLLAVATVTAGVATPARACSCAVPGTPEQEKEKAAAVFEGRVLEIGDGTVRQRAVRFEVLRAWKGVHPATTVAVETNGDSAACGVTVTPRSVMLVYAHAYAGGAPLEMSLCSRTSLRESAEDDIAALGPPLPVPEEGEDGPVATGGTIGGGAGGSAMPTSGAGGHGGGGETGTQTAAQPRGAPSGCEIGTGQAGVLESWAAAVVLLCLLRARLRPALLGRRRR